MNSNQPQYDTALAQNILTALGTAGISQDRGVKYGYSGWSDQNYQVNMDTVMPSCLIELGFMTNDTDNELFENSDRLRRLRRGRHEKTKRAAAVRRQAERSAAILTSEYAD